MDPNEENPDVARPGEWESDLDIASELSAYQSLLEAARSADLGDDESQLLAEDLGKARRRTEIAWLAALETT